MRIRVPLLILGCAALVSGCGAEEPEAGATGSAGVFPVTIESKHGSATIPARPERVVTLDNQSTDDALALGVVPVGMVKITFVPGDVQAWTADALRGHPAPELLDADQGVPFEQIAALRPDLILGAHAYQLEERGVYDKLARIAPVVHFARGSGLDSWQQTLRRVGQALGEGERAGELAAGIEADLAAVRERGALRGRTVNVFNNAGGVYAVSDRSDYAVQMLEDLGLRLDPDIDELPSDDGRAQISAERLDLLDADLLIGASSSAEAKAQLRGDTLFGRLDAVRDDRYFALDYGPIMSMVYPSALSIGWASRELVPDFERAVAGA